MKVNTSIFYIFLWTLIAGISLYWNFNLIEKNIYDIVKAQGKSFFEEIENTREWNALHKAIYVPVTDETQPNPYLKIENRDIYIDSLDLLLTMINPAYMTRQISEIAEKNSSVHYHLTSLNPIRPGNEANAWEKAQLVKFEEGVKESFEFEESDTTFNYMAPLITKESCLDCHKFQGYEVGQIRGGISISFEGNEYIKKISRQKLNIFIVHISVYALGLLSLIFFQNFSRKQFLKMQKALNLIREKNRIINHNHLKLEEKAKQLNETNNTKNKLFSIIAHDLKNPFGAILGLSDLLIDFIELKDTEKIIKYSKSINSSANEANVLLNNLLDWARIQVGNIQINPEIVDINEIVDEILALHEASIQQKNLKIILNLKTDLMIMTDKNMINTIIRNLLSNAIRFSFKSGTIEITTTDEDDNFIFSIKDHGIGVQKENIKKLFDLNENISTESTNGEKGTGLGLAICKDFIEILRGKINVQSELGKGSVFSFQIPLKQS